jgi:transcription antitermination factor NusG
MPSNWYALYVKPHKEQSVNDLLVANGITSFYPCLRVKPVNPRSRKIRPFFPGYIFVYLDLDEVGSNALRWTEGTYGLVTFGDEPAAVPENLIHEVRRRVDEHNAAGGRQPPPMEPGDRVVIVDGVFQGYEAIFDADLAGQDRVQVLLTYLSKHPKRLIIESKQIKKKD